MPSELDDLDARETFVATGEARNVLDADADAWAALESCLGRDPVKAWKLVNMEHEYVDRGRLNWSATWARDPHVEVPPESLAIADELPTLEELQARQSAS